MAAWLHASRRVYETKKLEKKSFVLRRCFWWHCFVCWRRHRVAVAVCFIFNTKLILLSFLLYFWVGFWLDGLFCWLSLQFTLKLVIQQNRSLQSFGFWFLNHLSTLGVFILQKTQSIILSVGSVTTQFNPKSKVEKKSSMYFLALSAKSKVQYLVNGYVCFSPYHMSWWLTRIASSHYHDDFIHCLNISIADRQSTV